ncbi:MAG: Curli production assembly/transport component CsgG [Fibrobacterota bacterium]|jgi:TolB-like protein
MMPGRTYVRNILHALLCLVGLSIADTPQNLSGTSRLPRMAILEIRNSSAQVSAGDLSALSARLETEFQKTQAFQILERRNMDAILREQGFQQSGACTSEDCQVQVGQLLGVERIVVGEVGKVGNLLTFNLKVVDVGTGQNLQSHALDVKGGMDVLLRAGAWEMAQIFSGKKKPASEHSVLTVEKPRVWPWVVGGTVVVAGAAVAIVYLIQNPPESNKKKTVESTAL